MSAQIFLVVMYDRHCDDEYSAHRSMKGATDAADDFMESYGSQYSWEPYEIEGWLYCHKTELDDGPNVHIEVLEIEP